MKTPRLKDHRAKGAYELYPLNEIPDEIIHKIASFFVYLMYIGRKDISGDDWGDAAAYAFGGVHLAKPVGIADVTCNQMAWSMKTVKMKAPFSADKVRLISGRCSPDYSYGISDPHEDIQKTGEAILRIWNERVNIAYDKYNPVRTAILVRSNDLTEFVYFEEECLRFQPNKFRWEENSNGNLEGYDIETNVHRFTWQPHGSQFTIIEDIDNTAKKFRLKKPKEPITIQKSLDAVNFDSSWVTILDDPNKVPGS